MNTWQKIMALLIAVIVIGGIIYDQSSKKLNERAEVPQYVDTAIASHNVSLIQEEKSDSAVTVELAARAKAMSDYMEKAPGEYINEVKEHFLDMGLDVKVYAKGKTLYVENALFNEVWYRKFQSDRVLRFYGMTFSKLIITDGFDYNKTLTIK